VAPDERIVLLPGAFGPGEGQDLLIDSVRLLAANGLWGVKFILTGDIERRSGKARELERSIEKADLRNIVFICPIPDDRPAAVLAAALVVLPATQTEASDRGAIEAQAMGTPLIVADIGALSETVLAPPGVDSVSRTGWLVPPNDPVALASAIGTVLNLGASTRESLGQRARAHIEKRYSRIRACTETLYVYEDLLSRRR
jgi:glycosyltransferase involved in cell wall biosynthesis